MIPMQWGFDDKIGERLIDVSVKRRKYIGYHNRYVFKLININLIYIKLASIGSVLLDCKKAICFGANDHGT